MEGTPDCSCLLVEWSPALIVSLQSADNTLAILPGCCPRSIEKQAVNAAAATVLPCPAWPLTGVIGPLASILASTGQCTVVHDVFER
jgi:hypothetical protein